MIDYKLLQALAAVVDAGGFDKAAKSLLLTQSAVSQRVKLLEERIGQILLSRSTPPRATPAGLQLLKHYRQVKLLEDDLSARLTRQPEGGFTSLAIGLNADSLATWFLEVTSPFLEQESLVLDLRVDDQEQTHRFLKNGEVVACVSTADNTIQGCQMEYLGTMNYRLLATPEFVAKWFSGGLTLEAISQAPGLIFNRKDNLHNHLLHQVFGEVPVSFPAHYVPSAEKFADVITAGLAFGMLPDQQSAPLLESGRLVNLAPKHSVPVRLHWHCWNLESALLEKLTRHVVQGAKSVLER